MSVSPGFERALFDLCNAGRRYDLRLSDGSNLTAIYHGYWPDGTMRFANEAGRYSVNPDHIIWCSEANR